MKKIYSIIILACLSVTGIYAESLDGIRKILCKCDGSVYNTAEIQRTEHNTAISEDIKDVGILYIKSPDLLSMIFKAGFDAMLYDKGTFTMFHKGKKRVAGETISNQLGLVFDVMDHIKRFNDITSFEEKAKISVSEFGNVSKITVEPVAVGKKDRRRLFYTSCEIEFDVTGQSLKSMKVCRRGGNYTLYTFGEFKMNNVLPDNVFKF